MRFVNRDLLELVQPTMTVRIEAESLVGAKRLAVYDVNTHRVDGQPMSVDEQAAARAEAIDILRANGFTVE